MTDQQEQPAKTAPKPPTKKRKLSVRVSESGHKLICDRASAADVTPSHMVRRMLAFAAEHMPAGYVPGRARPQPAPAADGQGRARR